MLIDTAMQDDARYQALLARDASQDGRWFYSVRTTGVYCRPSCASRPPRRENVAFHASTAEAEAAGFRPCKRCRPTEISAEAHRVAAIRRACDLIAAAEEVPKLEALADAAHMSPYHFHRTFRRVVGTTPAAFARAARLERLTRGLEGAASVTEAIYAAGYGSGARAYADAKAKLGAAPAALKAGGQGLALRYAAARTKLGWLLVAATDRGVASVSFGDALPALLAGIEARFPKARITRDEGVLGSWLGAIVAAVEAGSAFPDLPLDIAGTAFQAEVWAALRRIPAGQTRSYAEVAAATGKPAAVRAVAGACAANEIALLIPCHRVVRADGASGGYRWGEERKRKLLAAERAAAS